MYIQIPIDDQLYQQAVNLTGLTDKQALLEEALRLLIQTRKQQGINTTVTHYNALEHLRSVRISWNGKPIPDRNALYEDIRD